MFYKKYIITTLILIIAPIMILSTFTFIYDPYWVWQKQPLWYKKWGGHNRALDIRHRFAKGIAVITRQSQIIIVGSSRVYRGINTEKYADKQVYNLGISALKIREAKAYIHHIIRWTPVKKIIFGLDFLMFNNKNPWIAGFDPSIADYKYIFKAIPASLMTKMAFKDVILALSGKHRGDGYWTYSGYKKTNPRTKKQLDKIINRFYEGAIIITQKEYQIFAELVNYVVNSKVELKVYISPSNEKQLRKMKQSGKYDEYLKWRQTVNAILAQNKLSLYDFSENNPFFFDNIETGSTKYWIDTSHFSSVVGDWLLTEIGR